jgi:hypothetical protein
MKKYTLHTTDILKTEDFSIDLDDSQVCKILKEIGVELFKCEYSSEYYFIEATDEQISKLITFTFVDWIEEYDEDYFKFEYIVDCIKNRVNDIEYEKPNDLEHIEEMLNELKTIKSK